MQKDLKEIQNSKWNSTILDKVCKVIEKIKMQDFDFNRNRL
ncbi:15814_t:CDS:1, partial [Gigaspora rosea]